MCGLAGFLGDPVPGEAARPLLERMIGTLRHRGPDGFGFHVGPGIGLAHARLSIIDLATGEQPIRNGDGSTWTVFNGEIFNYVELRAELEAQGHRFYTQSDTEVIVHLYDRHGDAFVERLNGQFAIVLWDARRRRLLLARDRAGIRPLFYRQDRGTLWFASEMKALFAVGAGQPGLDPTGLAQALTYWGTLDPDTVFEGVQSLPPGHLLAIEDDRSQRLRQWWDWSFPAAGDGGRWRGRDPDDAVAELRALLIDAVRLQLRADVPVGAYLSGGLDSSGLVALARRFSDAPVRTFSVAFADAEFDERAHQQAMVAHLGCDHTTLEVDRAAIGAAFPRLVWHTETPVLRTAAVPLMLLSAAVRAAGYKVVLTGEGADEVFAGYDLFKEAKVRRFWARQPGSRWRPRLLERLYGYLANSPVRSPAFAQAFFGQGLEHIGRPVFAHLPRWTTSGRALGFLSPEARAACAGFDPLALVESRLPPAAATWSPLAQDQYVEARTLLAGYLLWSQGDRVAMANSVEGRVPYLDHRVIEFANALPPHWKLRGLTEKDILRRALADLLPPAIAARPKQPYRSPDAASFFAGGEPLGYVADLLAGDRLRATGLFDPVAVGRLLDKARAGRVTGFADNQAFVGILSTMLVDHLFVRGGALP